MLSQMPTVQVSQFESFAMSCQEKQASMPQPSLPGTYKLSTTT